MNPMVNPYQVLPALLEEVTIETAAIKSFYLRPERPFDFKCGQFAALTVPGVGEAPFAMASSASHPERLKFTVQRAGYMTERLHALSPGARLGLRGPFGNGFNVADYYGRHLLLVVGGVGFPPARALLHTAVAQKERFLSIRMCYGARSPEDVVYSDEISALRKEIQLDLTVDSAGETWCESLGVVTTLLQTDQIDAAQTTAVVIGPPVMMKFATLKLLDLNLAPENIVLSMERKMYCGIGQCRHCMIDHLFICKDGPVFTYAELQNLPDIWE